MTERHLSVTDKFGVASHVFRELTGTLKRLFNRVREHADPSTRYGEWRHRRSVAGRQADATEELFVSHTYVAVMARLVALQFVRRDSSPLARDGLIKVMTGDYFRELDIYNFAEEDTFGWVLDETILDEFLESAGQLLQDLREQDLLPSGQGLLTGLYDELAVPPRISRGRPPEENVLREQLQDSPGLSVLDPFCGPGEPSGSRHPPGTAGDGAAGAGRA